MDEAGLEAQTRGVKLLHLILLGGGVLVAIVFLAMVQLRGPILVPDSGSSVIAFAFAGVGLTAVAFAGLLVRPRIPARSRGEPLEAYWSSPARQRAIVLWVICDNAGIISALGYLLTGHLAAIAALGIALGALAWFGPTRLASTDDA